MLEQVAGVNGNQVGVQFRVVGHGGHDAHAHAQSDIGLDHIGVGGSEHDLGLEAGAVKGLIQLRAPGEPENIGHDGIIGYVAELKAATKAGQGMVRWRDDAAVPVVAGHHDQVIEQLQGLRGNGELDGAGGGQFRYLHGRALVHVQNDLRVFVPEAANDGGQNIARLGVGGGYGQRAAVLVRMLHGQLLQFVRLLQDGAGDIDDRPPRRGDFRQALAVALKDLQTQFFF